MQADEKVLVYQYRAGAAPVVEKGLAVITRAEVKDILEKHPDLQMSTKAIPRGVMSIDVYQKDVLTSAQAEAQGPRMNDDQNLAGIRLPAIVWLGSVFFNKYQELLILSTKTSL